jgi:hypothetical protein
MRGQGITLKGNDAWQAIQVQYLGRSASDLILPSTGRSFLQVVSILIAIFPAYAIAMHARPFLPYLPPAPAPRPPTAQRVMATTPSE